MFFNILRVVASLVTSSLAIEFFALSLRLPLLSLYTLDAGSAKTEDLNDQHGLSLRATLHYVI